MSANLPNVSSKYGAPMGRYSSPEPLTGKVYLRRVYLNSGGYDSGGAYWGIGEPLWHAFDDQDEKFFRAPNRDAAKALLPGCTFYR